MAGTATLATRVRARLLSALLVIVCSGCGLSLEDLRREALRTPGATAVPTLGDSHARYVPLLIAFAESHGYRVSFEPLENLWGMTNTVEHTIVMNSLMEPNGIVEGLAHEIGHIFHPFYLSPMAREIWVESVAALVVADIGLKASRAASVQYFANTKQGLIVMEREKETIEATAKTILQAIR